MTFLPQPLKAFFGRADGLPHAQQRLYSALLPKLDCGFEFVFRGTVAPPDLFDLAWARQKAESRDFTSGLRDVFSCAAQIIHPKDGNARANTRFDPDSTPALVKAILEGKMLYARRLLDSGADVNAADARGRTAVMAAAFMGETSFLQYMKCDYGAQFAAQDIQGRDVLDYALDSAKPDLLCVNFVLQEGSTFPGRETAVAPDLLQGNPKLPRIAKALVIDRLDLFKAMLEDRRIDFALSYPQFGGRDLFAVCRLFSEKAGPRQGYEQALASDPRAAKILPRDADDLHVFSDSECRKIFSQSGGNPGEVTFYSPYKRGHTIWPN